MTDEKFETVMEHPVSTKNYTEGEIVRNICAELDSVEAQIAELAAKRKGIRGRIKSELGRKLLDFDAMRRVAALDRNERDDFLRTLRLGFEALDVGCSLNFIDVMEQPPKDERETPTWMAEATGQQGLGGARDPKGELYDEVPAPNPVEMTKPNGKPKWDAKSAKVSGYNSAILGLAKEYPEGITHYLVKAAFDDGWQQGNEARARGETLDPTKPWEPPAPPQ